MTLFRVMETPGTLFGQVSGIDLVTLLPRFGIEPYFVAPKGDHLVPGP